MVSWNRGVVAGSGARDLVVAALESERRPTRSRVGRGAGAAAAMRWEHGDVVGEAQHLVAQRRVRVACEPLLQIRPEQIHARDVTDKKRTAAEEVLRIVGALQVADEERHVFGGVARRRDAAHAERTHFDRLSHRAASCAGTRAVPRDPATTAMGRSSASAREPDR